MLEALGRVINIAEVKDDASFQQALEQLSERIGQALDAEYCAIGFVHERTLEDVATWTRSPLTQEGKRLLGGARVVPISGSFIGSIVSQGPGALVWRESEGDPFDPNNSVRRAKGIGLHEAAAEAYRKVLPGGRVRDILLVSFTSLDPEPKPLGYLHLINRSSNRQSSAADREAPGFSVQQADRLKTIAALLATAITNYRNQRLAMEEEVDRRLIDSIQRDDPKTDPLRPLLTQLNERLESRVASLWLPVVDGFDPSPETRKMLLRTVVVSGQPAGTLDNQALEQALRTDGQVLQARSYVGRLLEGDPELEPHYQPNLAQQPHCWESYLNEIGTPRLLVVPIPDPLAPSDRPHPPEERLLAVLCVRPIGTDFHLGTPIQDRITRYAQFIQQLLLERRLKRRFSQIEDLRLGLDTVQVDDQAAFYRGLVDLVRDVMGAEACSLFLTAREPNTLVLKATTAAEAILEEPAGTRVTVKTESLLGRALYRTEDENFTSRAFQLKKAVLVCDTNAMQLGRQHFLEIVPTAKHRSVLAAPLVGSTQEVHGVLRCINLREGMDPALGFLPSDLRFFSLVASVLARFIEIAELASRLRRFMREVAHEFATPLLQAETNAAFLLRILEGRQSTRDPRTTVNNLRENVRHMQAQVRNMQFHTQSTANSEAVFNFNAPVDVHGLIDSLRKPMLGVARLSRGIEIFGDTVTLPALYVDRARMAQVFYNLLQNAVKHSPLGSKPIRIHHNRHEELIKAHSNFHWHRIRISNYGIGVPEGEEERIFEEYRRGSNTQGVRQGQSGAGLGLTIARRIVEGHGGILRLERNDNPTIFAVLLPAYLEKEPPHR